MNIQHLALPVKQNHYADFFEPSYPRRLLTMLLDLRKPRSAPEHRVAVTDMQRLSAQFGATAFTLLAVSLLFLVEVDPERVDPVYVVEWTASTPDPTPPQHADPAIPDPRTEPPSIDSALSEAARFDAATAADDAPGGQAGLAPVEQPLSLTKIQAISDSPPAIRDINGFKTPFGNSRGIGNRTRQIIGNGAQATDEAVLRALRWLKINQQADGSWKSQKIAMTGLAVLTFLAHNERPGSSPEFGDAVQKAVEFLLSRQKPDGHFSETDPNEYAHPIAAYALCEAYGMTLNPNVKAAAEKALIPIVKGQHPTGGWDYKMNPGVSSENGQYRDDTSYMGWCAQALKAAKLAQLHVDGLDKALKLTVKGFQKNASPDGGFGYTSPGQGGLTGVGTLCLQLLGAAGEPEVKKSLALMEGWRPSFEAKGAIGDSLQYFCYYATQAKFHAGGKQWDAWNREMMALYMRTQQIEKGAARDANGQPADVGWWVNGDTHTDRPVMDTCLAALQLTVYYRNLPTTSTAALQAPEASPFAQADTHDLPVIIREL